MMTSKMFVYIVEFRGFPSMKEHNNTVPPLYNRRRSAFIPVFDAFFAMFMRRENRDAAASNSVLFELD